MFSWQVISDNSPLLPHYMDLAQSAFPQPVRRWNGTHIAIFCGDSIVGGFTLTEYSSLSFDEDLHQNWNVSRQGGGTRLQKLWTLRKAPKQTIAWIFKALTEAVDGNDFVYGILSLPLDFARKNEHLLTNDHNDLVPRVPLTKCHWPESDASSSEGKRLLKFYLASGAKIIAAPSGDYEKRSIRVVLGIKLKNASATKKELVYAAADRKTIGY